MDYNFTGKCLVSAPWIEDEYFMKTLIFVCSHNQNGTVGFMFNHKLKEFSFSDLAFSLPIDPKKITHFTGLYQGGPVEKIRGFILHSPEYCREDTVIVKDHFAISSSIDTLSDIALGVGPKENLVALGYVAWGPNQLEKEIINNDWFVTEPTTELVFRTKDDEKWQKAIDEAGIDLGRIISTTGHS